MSQVDFINYVPLLIWSIASLLFFYFLIFVYILPLFFNALKVRSLYYKDLIQIARLNYLYLEFLLRIFKNSLKNLNLSFFIKQLNLNLFIKKQIKYNILIRLNKKKKKIK